MTTLDYPISYKYGETIRVFFFGDVHLGNRYCDWAQFKRDIAGQAQFPQTYFVGLGDYLDAIIPKDPRYLPSIQEDRFKGREDVIDIGVEIFSEALYPVRDRIVFLGEGNHEQAIRDRHGSDPVNRICNKLEVHNGGYSGLTHLKMREVEGRGRTVKIYHHHGWGGGSRTQGADLTKFSRTMQWYDADVFAFGHVHRNQDDKMEKIGRAGKRIVAIKHVLMICGTYLKTLSDEPRPTYSEKAGYPPSSLGGKVLLIKPDEYRFSLKVES